MGLLSDDLARAYFTAGDWKVGLLRKGEELKVSGYRPLKPTWKVDGSNGSASVVFKFDQFARFDKMVLYRDGILVDEHSWAEEITQPPHAEFVQDISIALTDG